MNYIFYYCDYYFLAILTFYLIIAIINFKFYLFYKQEKSNSLNKSKIIFLNFKISLFFILTNILSSVDFNYFKFELNFILIYKFVYIFFLFMFIFLLSEFSRNFKWFNYEFIIIFLFSNFCLFLLLQCNNFLNFYVILESYTLSICSVFVLRKLNKKLVDASFKYLILNILSSCLIVLGISNIYFSTGFLNFVEINQSLIFLNHLVYKNVFYLGYSLLFIGFSIKLTFFPFSMLLNEIYSGFNNIFVFFLLILPKFSFIFFLFYITSFLNDLKIFILFYVLSLLTAFFHSILSVYSLKIKNLIINISFSNLPFLVFPIFFKSVFSFVVFVNFSFVYFLNLFCFFCLLLFLNNFKKITNLVSVWFVNNKLTFLFLINLISLSSLPPFSGFFAKFYVFYLLIEYKLFAVYIFLSILNLIIIYCYLRIIKFFFIKNINLNLKNLVVKKNMIIFLFSLISLINIFFFFFFDILYFCLFIISNNSSFF